MADTTKSPITPTPKPGLMPKAYAGLTPMKLSILSCLLAKSSGVDDTAALVKRGVEVWNKASEALDPEGYKKWQDQAYRERGWISFDELSDEKRIPASKGNTHIGSSNGIKKAAKEFYARLEEDFDAAFQNHLVETEKMEMAHQQLRQQEKTTFDESRFPFHALELFQNFQFHRRNHTAFIVDLECIRAVLGWDAEQLGARRFRA